MRAVLERPSEVRNYVRHELESIEWWRVKLEATAWDHDPLDPWWRADLDLDGGEQPAEDFEDGLNGSRGVRRQLRDMTAYGGEVVDEWEPYDRVDQLNLMGERHHFATLEPARKHCEEGVEEQGRPGGDYPA
jgi:hypothetical protein